MMKNKAIILLLTVLLSSSLGLSQNDENVFIFPKEYHPVIEKRGDLGCYIAGTDVNNQRAIWLPEKFVSGKYVVYHKKTKKPAAFISYKDSLLNGKIRAFYKSSEPWYEGSYLNGEEEGIWTWHFKSGQKQAETNFEKGKLTGDYKFWNEDGDFVKQVHYKRSETNGNYKEWWPNGQLKIKSNYEDGYLTDSVIYYNQLGEIDSIYVAKTTVKERTEVFAKKKKVVHKFTCERSLTSINKKSTLVEIKVKVNEPYTSFLKFVDTYQSKVKISQEQFYSGSLKNDKENEVYVLYWSFPELTELTLSYIVNKNISYVEKEVIGYLRYISNSKKSIKVDIQ